MADVPLDSFHSRRIDLLIVFWSYSREDIILITIEELACEHQTRQGFADMTLNFEMYSGTSLMKELNLTIGTTGTPSTSLISMG